MTGSARWAAAFAAIAAVAGGTSACGGGGTTASVPAAPGAALTDRVLGASELGLAGYTASREPVVAQGTEDAEAADSCRPIRDESLKVLRGSGFQAAARRGFQADHGAALSAVWQFATPAGASAWEKEVLAQTQRTYPGCVPAGVTRTAYRARRFAGLPAGTLTYASQTAPDGSSEAWNLLFTDGRFVYEVGVVGAPGRVSSAAVIGAARRQWQRRNG
jgi:hypothetical protein